jgi:hypothetical protein
MHSRKISINKAIEPVVRSGVNTNPRVRVSMRYRTIRLMACPWDLRGLWLKRATWWTANWMSGLVLEEM